MATCAWRECGIKVEASRESVSRYPTISVPISVAVCERPRGMEAVRGGGSGSPQETEAASGSASGSGSPQGTEAVAGGRARRAAMRPSSRPSSEEGEQPGPTVMARWSATSDATRHGGGSSARFAERAMSVAAATSAMCSPRSSCGGGELRGDARDGDGREGAESEHGTPTARCWGQAAHTLGAPARLQR